MVNFLADIKSRGDMASENMNEIARAYFDDGDGAAMATVIETWRSSPRPVGAQLAIAGDGRFQGSISGGCVEGAVIEEARRVIETGEPKLLKYGLSDEDVFSAGLACGGTIRILVEPVGNELPANEAKPYRIHLETFERQHDNIASQSGVYEGWFHYVPEKPLNLYVIGAVHIAQALIPMARLAGYEVTLIDNRADFIERSGFDEAHIIHEWPADALNRVTLDERSALVTLTHSDRHDVPMLLKALDSPAFYIGALGSRKTHAARVEALKSSGADAAQIARISGPVGLDIGAATPAEIAISILAEMTLALRGKRWS